MKKSKPATEAQKIARERNWNKGQVMCMIAMVHRTAISKTTTKEEQKSLEIIKNHLNKIIKNWTK